MIIEFEDEGHIYRVNGQVADISVTGLLKKHGLSPSYKGVSTKVLRAKAEYGKKIHKNIEMFVKDGSVGGNESQLFAEWYTATVKEANAEFMLAYELDGWILAGTADLIGITQSGELFVSDNKCTATFDREYVSWQVSILDYMARKANKTRINSKPFKWGGATKFWCLHFHDGTMEVKELYKVPDSEIEELFRCEMNGEIYQRKELVLEEDIEKAFKSAEMAVMYAQKTLDLATEQAKIMRAIILEKMKEQGIKSWENESLKISYIFPTDRVYVDGKLLKDEYPSVYANCTRITKVGEQIRITVKKGADYE